MMVHKPRAIWFWIIACLAVWVIGILYGCGIVHAECYQSGRAVLAAGASHATWNMVDGQKCWRAGKPERKEGDARTGRKFFDSASVGTSRRSRLNALSTATVPLPRSKPYLMTNRYLDPHGTLELEEQLIVETVFRWGYP